MAVFDQADESGQSEQTQHRKEERRFRLYPFRPEQPAAGDGKDRQQHIARRIKLRTEPGLLMEPAGQKAVEKITDQQKRQQHEKGRRMMCPANQN